jgi:ribosomal protein L40E
MCFRPATAEKHKNICIKCRTENLPAATTCKNCGAKLMGLPPMPGQSGGLAPKSSDESKKSE